MHLSALPSDWQLKCGAFLQSAWAVNETSLGNLFTGVLMNSRAFLSAWGEYLMSAAAWLQVNLLCGHQKSVAKRQASKSSAPFCQLRSPQHFAQPTMGCIYIPFTPM